MSPWFSDLFLSSQSDERLVRLAQAGHQQAFTAIVGRYRRDLSRFANRACAQGKAEDVVQQTFLSAFTALQNGCQVRHLRGWLYAILRHHAARLGSHGMLETELADTAGLGIPLEDTVGQRMAVFEALSEIKRLPDNQRAALLATALEGRSRAEVASLLGLSEGAVRQLVHRARSTVRAAVTAITPFPLLRWVSTRARTTPMATAELVAGAGGAGTGAIVLKVGALVAAGIGVAGVAGVHPGLGHRSTPTVRIAAADAGLARSGSTPALAGVVGPLAAGRPSASTDEPGAAGHGGAPDGSPGAGSHGPRGADGQDNHGGGSDGSGRGGDSGHSGSSDGSPQSVGGDGGHGGASGTGGSGDSGGSASGTDGGGSGSGGSDGSSGATGGASGSAYDGGSLATPGWSGSNSTGGGTSDGGGGASSSTATTAAATSSNGGSPSGGDTTTATTSDG